MRFTSFFTLLGLAFLSCKNSKPPDRSKAFTAFDFSYNDVFSTCFSIKFTQSDTVFISNILHLYFQILPGVGKVIMLYWQILVN